MPFFVILDSLTIRLLKNLHFCLLLFSLSLRSFCGLVSCGWGLGADRVLIALSQACTANNFL